MARLIQFCGDCYKCEQGCCCNELNFRAFLDQLFRTELGVQCYRLTIEYEGDSACLAAWAARHGGLLQFEIYYSTSEVAEDHCEGGTLIQTIDPPEENSGHWTFPLDICPACPCETSDNETPEPGFGVCPGTVISVVIRAVDGETICCLMCPTGCRQVEPISSSSSPASPASSPASSSPETSSPDIIFPPTSSSSSSSSTSSPGMTSSSSPEGPPTSPPSSVGTSSPGASSTSSPASTSSPQSTSSPATSSTSSPVSTSSPGTSSPPGTSSTSSPCPFRCAFTWQCTVDCSTNPPTVGSVSLTAIDCISTSPSDWIYTFSPDTCHHVLQLVTVGDCCENAGECVTPETPAAPDVATAQAAAVLGSQDCPNLNVYWEVWRATGTCKNSPCECAFTIRVGESGNPAFSYAIWYEGGPGGPQTVFSSSYDGTGFGCLKFFDSDDVNIAGCDATFEATGTCDFVFVNPATEDVFVIAAAGAGPQPITNFSLGFHCFYGCAGPTHFYINGVTMECHPVDYFSPADVWTMDGDPTDSGCTIHYLFAHATDTSCCVDPPTPGSAPNPLLASEVEADCGGCAADPGP